MPPALLRCIAPVFLVWRQDADGAEAGAAGAAEGGSRDTTNYHQQGRRHRSGKFEQNLDLMRRSSTRFYTTQEVEKVLDSDNEEETPYMKNQTAS